MTSTEVLSILRRYSDLLSPERVDRSITALKELGLLESPDLITALSDSNPNLRLLAVEIPSELDPIEASLPALINALKDPDRIVRIAAVEPVARFGKKAHAAIPILEKWLDDKQGYIRLAAAAAIYRIDPGTISKMLPVLIRGLESGVSLDQSFAADALGNLGEAGTPALSVLEGLLDGDCAGVRCDAGNAIWGITGDPANSIRVGVKLLAAEEWLDRYVGAEHLGALGPVAAPALSDLRRLLTGDYPAVQTAVAAAIERIEGR